jgi:hypothetical protein
MNEMWFWVSAFKAFLCGSKNSEVSICPRICGLPFSVPQSLNPKITSVNLQIDPDVYVATRDLRRSEENMTTVARGASYNLHRGLATVCG